MRFGRLGVVVVVLVGLAFTTAEADTRSAKAIGVGPPKATPSRDRGDHDGNLVADDETVLGSDEATDVNDGLVSTERRRPDISPTAVPAAPTRLKAHIVRF